MWIKIYPTAVFVLGFSILLAKYFPTENVNWKIRGYNMLDVAIGFVLTWSALIAIISGIVIIWLSI